MNRPLTRAMVVLVAAFLGLAVTTAGHAEMIQLTLASHPERDGTVSETIAGSGDFNLLETGGISLYPKTNVGTLLPAQRALLEFDVSVIPAGSTIDAASISFRKGTVLPGFPGNSVDFLGYPGNGVLEISDATAAAALMTTIAGFPLPAQEVTYDIGTTVLQSVLGSSNFLGIRMQSDDAGAIFDATESIFLDPTLTIEFTPIPEPHALALLVIAGIAFYNTRCQRHSID